MSSSSDGGARLDGLAGVLTLVCALLVGAGLLLPSAGAQAAQASYRSMAAPATPTRLVVPALDLRAAVLPIEVNDRQVLDPPEDPTKVGWWQRSARVGRAGGQTVLTGHTVHTGGGVMDRLGKLRRDQVVKVVTPRGTMTYRTTRVVTWTKAELATRARQLFGQGRDRNRLVLITCTGWDGSDFTRNVVAFAEPLGVRTRTA